MDDVDISLHTRPLKGWGAAAQALLLPPPLVEVILEALHASSLARRSSGPPSQENEGSEAKLEPPWGSSIFLGALPNLAEIKTLGEHNGICFFPVYRQFDQWTFEVTDNDRDTERISRKGIHEESAQRHMR